ncbi:MAG: hypothetical protein J6C96_10685 [Oscillospiraceae bacterium]|nr:hypothetical protein [Oscillospiraceae bacterium]
MAKEEKLKQIELQNIIFDTQERKLMVSPQFLNDMTKHYVSKRMKNINNLMNYITVTKSPKNFFTYYNSVMKDLDELISIEPYYSFKAPLPSEFKKSIESKTDRYTEAMINRSWKEINQKVFQNPKNQSDERPPEVFGPVLDEMLEYKDKYTSAVLELIDKFYKSVYGHGINEKPETDIQEEAAPDSGNASADEDTEPSLEEPEQIEE